MIRLYNRIDIARSKSSIRVNAEIEKHTCLDTRSDSYLVRIIHLLTIIRDIDQM